MLINRKTTLFQAENLLSNSELLYLLIKTIWKIMNKSAEPSALVRGKQFEKRVKKDWKNSADGIMLMEHTINLSLKSEIGSRVKRGRLDILVSELGDFISIVEIKATNWDRIKPVNITKNLGSHQRQIWKYIKEFTDIEKTDVCAGVIYPSATIKV